MYKLTCVTAVYNAVRTGNEANLWRCVESVSNIKTFHEHLIYDGGSEDGTKSVLLAIQSSFPSVRVISEKDRGIYNALNKGVRDAQGEWFYVLGCDDYIVQPQVVDELIKCAEENGIAEVVANVFRNGKFFVQGERMALKRMYKETPYCHQGVIMRTSVVREFGGFNEDFRIAADMDLMMKIHKANKPILYRFDKAFAEFSCGGMSTTAQNQLRLEWRLIVSELLGLSERERHRLERDGVLSLCKILPLLIDTDYATRVGGFNRLVDALKFRVRVCLPIVYKAYRCVRKLQEGKSLW